MDRQVRRPWAARDAFRVGLPQRQSVTLRCGGLEHVVVIERDAGCWCVSVGDEVLRIEAALGEGRIVATLDGCREVHDLHASGTHLSLWRGAARIDFELLDPRRADVTANAHEGELVARLPGTVVSVAVAVGDIVEPGATLMVVEAMKMEHAILAPHGGRVAAIHHATGERVTEGAVLAEIVPLEQPPATT